MKTFNQSVLVTGVALFFVTLLSPSFAQEAPKLSDAEIASVAVVANQNDINFANLAMKKSKDAKVKEFAKTMIADHQSVINMAIALVTKLKVTPKDNAVSQQYLASAKETEKMLNSKSGKAFDKAYVDNEVTYHKAVIEAVKTVLIAQAQNAELKALLEKAVPIFETHLHHAEMVQSQMK